MRRIFLLPGVVLVLAGILNGGALAAERAGRPGSDSASKSAFEAPPVLKAANFLPPGVQMKGKGWWIEEKAVCDGFNATVVIHAGDHTLNARGPRMVQTRLHEAEAAMRLDEMKTSAVFLKGAGESVSSLRRAVTNAVHNPGTTIMAVPDGVGRFFERTAHQASAAVNSDGSARKNSKPVLNALGYDKNRRMLAKELGVDPYTTNPYLKDKLDEVAWAAFAGGLGVSALTTQVPGANIISATGVISDMVYDKPSGDLEVWIEKTLKSMGVASEASEAFLRNNHFTLTLQAEIVMAMEKLKGVKNLAEILTLANTVKNEDQARFMASVVHMLADEHRALPLKELRIGASISGITADGRLIAPVPVDYLCWTARVAAMAGNEDLRNYERKLLVYGRLSPRAASEFRNSGWSIQTYILKPDPKLK